MKNRGDGDEDSMGKGDDAARYGVLLVRSLRFPCLV